MSMRPQDKIKVAPITRSAYPTFGTSGLVNIINEYGMFPINNYQKGYSPEAENISGEAIREQILVKDEGCFGCPDPVWALDQSQGIWKGRVLNTNRCGRWAPIVACLIW